jgi:hypothetical protein
MLKNTMISQGYSAIHEKTYSGIKDTLNHGRGQYSFSRTSGNHLSTKAQFVNVKKGHK